MDVAEVQCEKKHKRFSDWQKDTFKHMPGDFLETPIFESNPRNPKNNDSSKLVFLGCWFKSKDECVLKISEKCFLDGYGKYIVELIRVVQCLLQKNLMTTILVQKP